MNTQVKCAAIVAAALALPGAASTSTPALSDQLAPLRFLVGSCWSGQLSDGKTNDTHCFTPMLGGKYMRDRHQVSPADYGGETIYRWDPASHQIRYQYYASDGGQSSGMVQVVGGGLVLPDDYVGPDGRRMALRTTWMRTGNDGYTNRVEVNEAGKWRELWHVAFKRAGPADA